MHSPFQAIQIHYHNTTYKNLKLYDKMDLNTLIIMVKAVKGELPHNLSNSIIIQLSNFRNRLLNKEVISNSSIDLPEQR